MCLGIPGRLVDRFDKHGAHFGRVDVDGTVKDVCLEFLPELEVGQYAIVHLGFAISQLHEDEAMDTLELMSSLGGLAEGPDPAQLRGSAARSGDDGPGS